MAESKKNMSKSKKTSVPTSAEIQKAYETALHRYIGRPEVTGITIGPKIKRGQEGAAAIRIYVAEKFDTKVLLARDVLPEMIGGVPTDIIPRRYRGHAMSDAERRLRRYRVEPLQPGVSLSLPGGNTGTLGLIVRKYDEPKDLGILTAAHVVVRLNSDAQHAIIQPPASFSGSSTDKIAELGAFLLPPLSGDAAFCKLTTPRRLNVRPYGLNAGVHQVLKLADVKEGIPVEKSGMMTGVTKGDIEAVGMIKYRLVENGPMVLSAGFEIKPRSGATGRLSRDGDSGACWVRSQDGAGVGLHVAGEEHPDPDQGDRAFACFLETVLKELHLELIPAADLTASRFTSEDMRRV